MSDFKHHRLTIVTPRGVAQYPKLIVPDTKFKEMGEFSVKLLVGEVEAGGYVKKITALRDAGLAEFLATPNFFKVYKVLPKDIKVAPLPFKDVLDDNGNPTGNIEISLKRTASYKDKDNGGKIENVEIKLIDAGMAQITGGPRSALRIGGGSEMRVSANATTYYMNNTVGFGVKLRIDTVQLFKVVSWGNGAGGTNGFDVEDGFRIQDTEGATSESAPESVTSVSNAQASDF